jgi:beta-lactamase regulating signal transducer with metallopeptidase domain
MQAIIELLLQRLLASSLQLTVLAVVVWILCRYMLRLSARDQCRLWWLVSLQAVAGLVLDPIQLPWLPQTPATISASVRMEDQRSLPDLSAATASVYSWHLIMVLCWISGVMLMCWSTLRSWRLGQKMLRVSSPVADATMEQALRLAAAAHGVRKIPQLRLSRLVESPLLIGHRHPVLLLPADATWNVGDLEMILAHELAHLRRGDLWWGWVPSLVRHLFFFHPVAHLAVREYGIAREAACDAAVLDADHRSRHDYGRLLVRLGATPQSVAGSGISSPTFIALKRRLHMLQNTAFLSRTSSTTLLVVIAAVGVLPLRLVAATTVPPAVPAAPAPPRAQAPARAIAPKSAPVVAPASATAPTVTAPVPNPAPAPISAAEQEPRLSAEWSASPSTTYTGSRITASFKDIPVPVMLKLLADTGGRNMLVSDAVSGSMTLQVRNVPWDQVLDTVLSLNGLEKRVENNVIMVGPAVHD